MRRSARTIAMAVLVAGALAVGACSSGSAAGGGSGAASGSGAPPDRPTIVVFLADDQRFDSIDQMPWLNGQTDWARFANMFTNDPQCCPSRATILTGRYTQHTGVETLDEGPNLDESVTVATMLHDAGYRTGLFGKYLNRYPFGRGNYIPPGWDEWAAYEGGTTYSNYKLNEDGTVVSYGEDEQSYSTDVLAAKARDFIASTPASQPLFLYLPFNAPHFVGPGWSVPAVRDQSACLGRPPARPVSLNADDHVSEPTWLREAAPARVDIMDSQLLATCQTLVSVDAAVQSVLDQLRASGRLDSSYLMYTSDNGYHFGEHKLWGKGDLYEESIRVPLLVKGPNVRPTTLDRLTSNVDLTPTILDWAGVTAPDGFLDGSSFAANLRGEAGTVPTDVLLRGCRTKGTGGDDSECGGYTEGFGKAWGLRTATHKFVEYEDGFVQLFDLTTDPAELSNRADDPSQAALVAKLRARVDELRQP